MQFELQQTQNIQFIPLITAVAVCRSLKQLGVEACQIKWPNDIYLEGKKLAGILVESRFNAEKSQYMWLVSDSMLIWMLTRILINCGLVYVLIKINALIET
ncbi:hypothetical protein [sulfur-oxidizing endosymbiont of Gigantopelta aegis]|uniref:hypothetical protein n=1 Tax=sulfur-oxidizing endosymbiont of Gigantopelta aegis TaxID=2794934 RepID=UPI0018DD422E